MANANLTVKAAGAIIAKTAAAILHDKLHFIKKISRESDSTWTNTAYAAGAKAGDTIKIRKPNRFTVRTGATFSGQDTNEESVTFAVATQKGVDITGFTSAELATDLGLKQIAKRVIEPAMKNLASAVEAEVMQTRYSDIYNVAGTPGTTPNAFSFMTDTRKVMNKDLTPQDDDRCLLIDADTSAAMVDALKGLFHSSTQIEQQYTKGMLGLIAGFTVLENQLLPTHTNGDADFTSALVNGAGQTGATLACDGFGASEVVTKGTVFTIAGVEKVHPETKTSYGTATLQTFTVTADTTADGGGAIAALPISPSITATGGRQNVSAAPADGVALVVKSGALSTAYGQNLGFHKDAFVFASVPLVLPEGVHMAAQETVDGLTVRVIQDYSLSSDKLQMRLDILYGSATVNPEYACRLTK